MRDFHKKNYYFKLAKQYFDLFEDEVKQSHNLYDQIDYNTLEQFYSKYFRRSRTYTNYAKYRYCERAEIIIKNVEKGKEILDAGCGPGTETILCELLGGFPTGVDFEKERIRLACNRIKFYEKKFTKKMNIMFLLQDIFKHHHKYDLIWVNEAISHINPLDKFLKLCYNNLKINGKLIIADGNKFNPLALIRSRKDQKRKKGIYRIVKDPNTGEDISYAVERIVNIFFIKAILRKYFRNITIYYQGYFPYFIFKLSPDLFLKFERLIICKIPIIKYLSGGYVISSMK